MKTLFFSALIVCAILPSCKKEIIENTAMVSVKNNSIPATAAADGTIDNPKKIKGRLQNTSYTDIQGATVNLYDATGFNLLKTTYSNDTGGFVIDSINPGDYDLQIIASGYQNEVLEITVLSNVPEYNAGIIQMEP